MAEPTELLHGTLDALVLKTLAWGPRHGYAIARWIEQISADALRIEEGSLYPALYRLERQGWIEAEWGLSDTKRRVKLYRLTDEARMAPNLRGRINMAIMAAAEMNHYEVLRDALQRRGVDVVPAMTKYASALENYHRLTTPSTCRSSTPSLRTFLNSTCSSSLMW